ncbi:MAG: antitermination protein NusG [Planctomycetes bacterium]|nr:antitermination protein NusG [Planctomycetota bacterium]
MPILEKETSVFPENLLDDFTSEESDREFDRGWWAIYTKARQEKAVARSLLAYEIPFFLPLVGKDQCIRGRRVRSHLPLFDGYLFLYGSDDERVRTLTTNRISRILPVGDGDQLVCDLRNLETLIEQDAPLTVEKRLTPGDRVRVKYGDFRGVEGTLLRRHNGSRILVSVNYLQQGVSLEIEDFMVEPI